MYVEEDEECREEKDCLEKGDEQHLGENPHYNKHIEDIDRKREMLNREFGIQDEDGNSDSQ
jgi:hypothetical protein